MIAFVPQRFIASNRTSTATRRRTAQNSAGIGFYLTRMRCPRQWIGFFEDGWFDLTSVAAYSFASPFAGLAIRFRHPLKLKKQIMGRDHVLQK